MFARRRPRLILMTKVSPKTASPESTLLISSEYHCNHPFASLVNRKLKSLSCYDGQISILFPGVLHIFVEGGQHLSWYE
jgi:hypothetical protein